MRDSIQAEHDPSRRRPGASFDFDGEYGERYEALAVRVIPAYRQLFEMAVALLQPTAPERARVLVVGCGTGVEMAAFGAHRPEWEIVGVDPSEQMVELARRKLAAEGLAAAHRRAHHGFVSDVATDPPFDVATLYNVLHFLPDDGSKAALLRDIAARLVPGGELVMVDLHGEPGSPGFRRLQRAWEDYMLVRGMTPPDRGVFLQRLANDMHYVSGRRIVELLREAGFSQPVQFYRAFLYGGWLAGRV